MQAAVEGQSDPRRFVALDSLRGVCACTVVLFHLGTSGVIGASIFARQGWLFVDFFFVLSGFVIARSYGDKIADGFPIARFMFLRLMRVYPLHLFMLALFVMAELVILAMGGSGGSGRQAFDLNHSFPALLSQITLTQIFGLIPRLTWNGPSWSIAAEVWTYLIFAGVFWFAGKHRVLVSLLLCAGAGTYLSMTGDHTLDRTIAEGLPRCIFSFSLGVIAARIYPIIERNVRLSAYAATILECGVLIAYFLFMAAAGRTSLTLLAPFFFFAIVLIFAYENGLFSRMLQMPAFVLLGTLSYSIYMTHMFAIMIVKKFLAVVGRLLHVEWVAPSTTIIAKGFTADAIVVMTMVAIVAASIVTRRLIEVPSNLYARRAAARFGAANAERRAPDM